MKTKIFRMFMAVTLSLSALFVNASQVCASFENFLTWTEVDGGSNVTVSQYSTQWVNEARSAVNYVYSDLGADYLDTSFQVTFQVISNGSTAGTAAGNFFTVANDLGTQAALSTASEDFLALGLAHPSSPNEERIHLRERVGVNEYDTSGTDYYVPAASTTYYITMIRDETTGTYGQLRAYIYSNAAMTAEYLLSTLTLNLHQKTDFRYVYAHQSIGAAGAYYSSGLTSYMELTKLTSGQEPLVITTGSQTLTGKVRLTGWASIDNGALTDIKFEVGTESGTYTDNYTATYITGSSTYFYVDLTSSNLTAGETYYFLASATNAYGIGYGSEHSLIAAFQTISITTSEIQTEEQVNGKFSATFDFFVSPNNVTTAYGRMSTTANFTAGAVDLEAFITAVLGDGQGQYSYITHNAVDGYGLLEPDTTYYYQGYIAFEGQVYYGKIKSFTTESVVITVSKPTVSIISIKDVHESYGGQYLFEFKAHGSSSNTTDLFYVQGFDFSLYYNESVGTLLPTIYSYTVNKNADNTFYLVVNLDNADWYSGQTLYIRAFVNALYYGKVYSAIASFSPEAVDDGSGITTNGDADDEAITQITDLFTNIRTSWGLTGVMGTWAFLGLLILVIALIFGVAIVSTKDDTLKRMIGIVWGLASVAVLGAFLFTGQLGIWPIVVMVGGVVVVVFVLAGSILSGSSTNG